MESERVFFVAHVSSGKLQLAMLGLPYSRPMAMANLFLDKTFGYTTVDGRNPAITHLGCIRPGNYVTIYQLVQGF